MMGTAFTFAKIAQSIANSANRLPDAPLTGIRARRGFEYSNELMWIGRAVNGWGSGYTPSQLAEAAAVNRLIAEVDRVAVSVNGCPMQWVSNQWGDASIYNTARSAFWRTAKEVLEAIGDDQRGAERIWPSRLVWSNLFKFAPESGGNPGDRLAAVQFDGCRDLLLQEVEEFRPKHLVMATGTAWAEPFLDLPCFDNDEGFQGNRHVHRSGNLNVDGETVGRFVVADHPMGRKEAEWVGEVVAGLQAS